MSSSPEAPASVQTGAPAPHISLTKDNTAVNLNTLRGKYVVLNYWSRRNPESRVANHFYDKAVNMLPDDRVVYISVCADLRDESLSRLISQTDGNCEESQYYASERGADDGMNLYLADGYGTWLISPQGILLAHNPTISSLATL